MSARVYLLLLLAAALLPVWLFAAYLLTRYALNERERFEREAMEVARQVALVGEGELMSRLAMLEGLSQSTALLNGDYASFHAEAKRLVADTGQGILLRDLDRRQVLNTERSFGDPLPPAVPLTADARAALEAGRPLVSDVYASPLGGEPRVAIALPVRGAKGERLVLAVTVSTARLRDVIVPAVPPNWVVGVGDRQGTYVTRSQKHDEVSGRPGVPEYVAKAVGRSGTFTADNFEGLTLLAGYYRPDFSGWLYAANVPLSVVEAPLWRSLVAIGGSGLVAMLVSLGLATAVGEGFARSARGLAGRARALGEGRPVAPMATPIREFAVIADALSAAERALVERAHELRIVLETVPAAVWFTYDPAARQVIRNRFAADLMGLPEDRARMFGAPDQVIDTKAFKDGRAVSREERPLTRAMRGEETSNEEFAYVLPDGTERVLLSSARPIRDVGGRVVGAVQISLDISERKRGEEQRRLLVNELNHRVKNTLAVVQSIAAQTLRAAATPAEARDALSGRLASLGKAHDLLTRENWSGADLSVLVAAAVSPHASLARFEIAGEAVWLQPTLALSLSLALHELATNALKYGALSSENGSVRIGWTVDAENGARRLTLEWRETGGPAVVPQARQGFGTRLLARLLDAEPGGRTELAFAPAGLVCRMSAELTAPAGPQPLAPDPL